MIEPIPGPPEVEPPRRREAEPWTVFCLVFVITCVSFVLVGPFIGLAVAFPFYDGKAIDYFNDIADPFENEQMKSLLMLVQACATFFGLAVIPVLFWRSLKHKSIFTLVKKNPVKPIFFLMIIGIVIFFMGPNSVFMEWNSNINLPDGPFEDWVRNTEDRAAELTKYMTSFSTGWEYLIGVIVIAVLAAVGEEVVFRGMLQPELQKGLKNIHAGIWISAIFFSAFHLQFYGFVPRVLLGALFGYLYYWSGNLIVPMFAHFINNFFAVTVIYMGMEDLTGTEGKDPTGMPWYAVLVFTALCGMLMYQFYKMQPKRFSVDDVGA